MEKAVHFEARPAKKIFKNHRDMMATFISFRINEGIFLRIQKGENITTRWG